MASRPARVRAGGVGDRVDRRAFPASQRTHRAALRDPARSSGEGDAHPADRHAGGRQPFSGEDFLALVAAAFYAATGDGCRCAWRAGAQPAPGGNSQRTPSTHGGCRSHRIVERPALGVWREDVCVGLCGARVEIERRLDGSHWLRFGGRYLPLHPCPAAPRSATPSGLRPAGVADQKPQTPAEIKTKYIPLPITPGGKTGSGHFYFALTAGAVGGGCRRKVRMSGLGKVEMSAFPRAGRADTAASARDGGIVHGLRGRPSNRKMPARLTACRAPVASGALGVSRETLRNWMSVAGLWPPRSRQVKVVHVWRPRRTALGELVMMDGSPYRSQEERGPSGHRPDRPSRCVRNPASSD